MGYGQFMCHQTLFELLPSDMSGTRRWTLDTGHWTLVSYACTYRNGRVLHQDSYLIFLNDLRSVIIGSDRSP